MSPEPLPIDGARILESAHRLAFPRYPGTVGDARAIELVEQELRGAGLAVDRQEFSYDVRPAFRALRVLMVVCALLVAGAGLTAGGSPGLAAALLAAALLAGGAFLVWAPGLERLYRRDGPTRTANVEGRVVTGGQSAGEPRLRLVVLAHHDSKSQSLTLPWRVGLTLAALAGALTLAGVLIAAAAGAAPPPWLPPAAGLSAAAALLVLATLRNGNLSPGGVDNAGSVGVLLELARVLPGRTPAGVELVFLSPGAEEDHMVGAMRWLDRHAEELAALPVYALNLDGAGIPGRLTLLERYGLGRPFSPRLSALARQAAARLGIPVRGILMPPALGVDAIPFAHRGVECLTLASGSLGRAVLAIHSAGDRAEHLDREALVQAARLAAEVLLSVART